MTTVLFCGSREIGNGLALREAARVIKLELDRLNYTNDIVVHGGAKGIDTLVDTLARGRGFLPRIVTPNYRLWPGRVAPLKRDQEMVDQSDYVVAIWNGVSKGTKYTVNLAIDSGKEVRLYRLENSTKSATFSLPMERLK
jgi:hypothetical protein